MPMKHLESWAVTTEISIFYIDFWFMVFHCTVSCCFITVSCCFIAVSLLFHAVSLLFHAVSLLFHCCFIAVSCCFTVFHRSVSWCFKVFHCPVSSCFMTMKQVQWERALCHTYYIADITGFAAPVISYITDNICLHC